MSGHLLCCRYEPSLEDLLAEDEVMMPVLKSAGLDRKEFRALLMETARRLEGLSRFEDRRSGLHSP
jgi:hypothetical protein